MFPIKEIYSCYSCYSWLPTHYPNLVSPAHERFILQTTRRTSDQRHTSSDQRHTSSDHKITYSPSPTHKTTNSNRISCPEPSRSLPPLREALPGPLRLCGFARGPARTFTNRVRQGADTIECESVYFPARKTYSWYS